MLEDEAEVRALAAEHLSELCYKAIEAKDSPEALRMLEGSRPGLPVLSITGYADGALEEKLTRHGADR